MKRPSPELIDLLRAVGAILWRLLIWGGFAWTAIRWDWNHTLVFGALLLMYLVTDATDRIVKAIREGTAENIRAHYPTRKWTA